MTKKQGPQQSKAPGSFGNQGAQKPNDAMPGPEERYQQAQEQVPTREKPGAKRTDAK